MGYAPAAVGLVACPFCRELFEEGEATSCPVCAMTLAPFEKLGPSHDAMSEDGVPPAPEKEIFAATYFGRARGPLAIVGLLGLTVFFLPWIKVTLPHDYLLSGFDLGKRLVWVWMAMAAWIVLVPTVLSRRSIWQLRTARLPAIFLAAVPAVTTTVLYLRPPRSRLIPLEFTFGWPFWATLVLSAIAIVLAFRLGGRMDDIRVKRGNSSGQSLH